MNVAAVVNVRNGNLTLRYSADPAYKGRGDAGKRHPFGGREVIKYTMTSAKGEPWRRRALMKPIEQGDSQAWRRTEEPFTMEKQRNLRARKNSVLT